MQSSYSLNNYDSVFNEIISHVNPGSILEIGILDGYSLNAFVKYRQNNCKITAIDLFDNTLEKAKSLIKSRPENIIKVLTQTKNGKANAVWEGLELSDNDAVAILDSDLSVDPEKLTDFFEIIENGHADFVNGTRLIYKMEKGAMQSLNKLGNRFFQFIISKLISVRLTDSLCGTKVFKKENIQNIKKWQNSMKFEDPFCDFDLIFSAAYSSQKIVELPVYYRTRKYGSTNISRFKDGWKLLFYFFNSYILFKTDFKKEEKFKLI